MKKAAVVVIRTLNKEYLLLKRPKGHKKPGWCLPGGKEEPSDVNIKSTALREVYEETKIELPYYALNFKGRYNTSDSKGNPIEMHVYAYDIAERCKVKISEEHEAYLWIKITDLVQMVDELSGKTLIALLL